MSPDNSSVISTPKANMRPLTQAYQTAHAEHEVCGRRIIFSYFEVIFHHLVGLENAWVAR